MFFVCFDAVISLRSITLPLIKIFSTCILFLVSVPVLSVHIYVMDPNVSTAGSFLIRLLYFIILLAAIAREMVITAGRASGMAATASEILVSTSVIKCSPRIQPAMKKTMHKNKINMDSFLEKDIILICKGVKASCSCNILAIRPNSVCIPVAITNPDPLP